MEITDEDRAKLTAEIEKHKNDLLKQNRSPAYRPVATFGGAMGCFIGWGVLFIGMGIWLVTMSSAVFEISIDYTDCVLPTSKTYGSVVACDKEFTIPEAITTPLYAYYELTNFYQNHRRYVKSRSYQQLMGLDMAIADVKTDCDPIVTNADLAPYITKAVDGTPLVADVVANPCGLVAKSLFTDTFVVYQHGANDAEDVWTDEQKLTIDDSDIAWASDVTYKFKRLAATNWNTL